jgi:DnaJ-class molecular chaperone
MNRLYHPRTEDCPDCDGGLVYDYGYTARTCPTCDGHTEIDSACCECGIIAALNDEGECERCHDANTLPVAEFQEKYGLTECLSNPLKDLAA